MRQLFLFLSIAMVILGATTVYFYAERQIQTELERTFPVTAQAIARPTVVEPARLPEIFEPIELLPDSASEARTQPTIDPEIRQASHQDEATSRPKPLVRFDRDPLLVPWMPYADEEMDVTHHLIARQLLEQFQTLRNLPWQALWE